MSLQLTYFFPKNAKKKKKMIPGVSRTVQVRECNSCDIFYKYNAAYCFYNCVSVCRGEKRMALPGLILLTSNT